MSRWLQLGLHQTIARALDNRTDYGDARLEYGHAAALFADRWRTLSGCHHHGAAARNSGSSGYEKDSLPLAEIDLRATRR